MNRLLIVGAGGFGREVYCWAQNIQPTQSDWYIGGFLDANPRALKDFDFPAEVVGDPAKFIPNPDDRFTCAVGDPVTKERMVTGLLSRGAQFETLIHPTAIVGVGCEFGQGCILCPHVIVTTNVRLGMFVTLNLGTTVGHDAKIGNWSNLFVHTDLGGGAILGERVSAGSHAFVLPGVSVGDGAILGAGAIVNRPVAPGSTVAGVPARLINTKPGG